MTPNYTPGIKGQPLCAAKQLTSPVILSGNNSEQFRAFYSSYVQKSNKNYAFVPEN
jgi:hypothetical protein